MSRMRQTLADADSEYNEQHMTAAKLRRRKQLVDREDEDETSTVAGHTL